MVFSVTTSGANVVQCKLAYADVNGRKRRQSSTMLNFQGQRKLTLTIQPIRKALQGHRKPTHRSATATHGRVRWPLYTSMRGVTCAGTRLPLLCNVYAQHERLRPLTAARSINPALVGTQAVQMTWFLGPTWGQPGSCPVSPMWAPCWPHQPCYQGVLGKN